MLNLEWSNIISCNFFGDDIGSMVADFFFFWDYSKFDDPMKQRRKNMLNLEWIFLEMNIGINDMVCDRMKNETEME